jgi:hypothetical protein
MNKKIIKNKVIMRPKDYIIFSGGIKLENVSDETVELNFSGEIKSLTNPKGLKR